MLLLVHVLRTTRQTRKDEPPPAAFFNVASSFLLHIHIVVAVLGYELTFYCE